MKHPQADSLVRLRALIKGRTTQRALANSIGTSEANISRWMSGKYKLDAHMLGRICESIDVSADYILWLSDDPGGHRESRSRIIPIYTLQEASADQHPAPNPQRPVVGVPPAWAPKTAAAVAAGDGLLAIVDLGWNVPTNTTTSIDPVPSWGELAGLPFLVVMPQGPMVLQFLCPISSPFDDSYRLKFAHLSDVWHEEVADAPKSQINRLIKGPVVAWIRRTPTLKAGALGLVV